MTVFSVLCKLFLELLCLFLAVNGRTVNPALTLFLATLGCCNKEPINADISSVTC